MPFSTTYSKIKTFVNGGKMYPSDLDGALDDIGNQLASVNVAGGFNEGSNVRRGKCIVPGSSTRTNAAYGLMGTPDQVQSVVLPTDGLIFVAYQALWYETVNTAAKAAIFLNSNQIQMQINLGLGPGVGQSEASIGAGSANRVRPIASSSVGLSSLNALTSISGSSSSDITTGQIIGGGLLPPAVSVFSTSGGPCAIFAAAGTYTVSVQFKASSGDVVVSGRKLWVWTENF
jgi:hypothetical protein